jgi:RNA polymerase sigma-70 factor, ECF subfamily
MSQYTSSDPLELLRRARAGSGPDMGRLLELYRKYLTLLARLQIGRRLQGKVDAADLVQDTFLQAHRGFDQFRGTTEEELIGWLRQIMAHCLAMCVRRYYGTQRRDIRLERELAVELDQSSRDLDPGFWAKSSSPSHRAVRREQAVLLADALGELTDDYREVLILRHMEGLSFPEVARRMGRTVDSVKKLWPRAMIQLRRGMGENL